MRVDTKRDRESLALLALFRGRTTALFRIAVLTFAIIEAIIIAVNTQTLSQRYSDPGQIRLILGYQIFQGSLSALLAAFAFSFRRFFQRIAQYVLVIFGLTLIIVQSSVFLYRPDHPRAELIVMLVFLPIALHVSRRWSFVFVIALAAIASGISFKKFTVNEFAFPVIAPPIFISIMGIFFRDMLAKQAIALKVRTRQLSATLTQVMRLKKDQDIVFETIEDGLFIIQKDGTLSLNHSLSVEKSFGYSRFAGKKHEEFFNTFFSETAEAIAGYIRLLFNARQKDSTLLILNPLQTCSTRINGDLRKFQFEFRRIRRGEEIAAILVRTRDYTKESELEEKLVAEEKFAANRQRMILSALTCDAMAMQDFLASARADLKSIQEIIASDQISLDGIRRHLHAIKGNAAALQLAAIADIAHQAESRDDTSKLAHEVARLTEVITDLEAIITALKNYSITGTDTGFDLQFLKSLATTLAKERKTRIRLNIQRFRAEAVPQQYHKLVRDACIQFIRNTFAHAIQPPEARAGLNKDPMHNVTLTWEKDREEYNLFYRDDGNGIQTEKLIEKAKLKDIPIPHNANDLIFAAGLSSTEKADLLSGRGVGMDLIMVSVKAAGGSITVTSEPSQFTQFIIKLPAQRRPDDGSRD